MAISEASWLPLTVSVYTARINDETGMRRLSTYCYCAVVSFLSHTSLCCFCMLAAVLLSDSHAIVPIVGREWSDSSTDPLLVYALK